MKILKPMIAGLAIVISLAFSLFAQTPEPPCPFTNPCIDGSMFTWEEKTYVHQVAGCPGCTFTYTYLFFQGECMTENGMIDYFAFYLDAITMTSQCSICMPDPGDRFNLAAQIFTEEVLNLWVPSGANTTVADFKLKSCYKLEEILDGEVFEPCENLIGCCEYYYREAAPHPDMIGWTESTALVPCDYYAQPYQPGDCFSACGAFGDNLIYSGKISVPTSDEISIHPNPADNQLNIAFDVTVEGNIQIEIIDMEGSVVIENNYQNVNGVVSLDISKLQSGTYFTTIKNNNETLATKKLVIAR